MARLLLTATRGKLLLNALLPRGDGQEAAAKLCPPRCNRAGQPFTSFAPAVHKVNALIAAALPRLEKVVAVVAVVVRVVVAVVVGGGGGGGGC